MASSNGKIQSFIDFSTHLIDYLNSLSELSSEAQTAPDPTVYIRALPLVTTSSTSHEKQSIRTKAGDLWNLCNRHSSNSTAVKWLSLVRAFSFLLLVSTKHAEDLTTKSKAQWVQLANTSIRDCLAYNEVDVVEKLLQYAVTLHQQLVTTECANDTEYDEIWVSIIKYDNLRVASAWKRQRLDLADHYYSSVEAHLAKLCLVSSYTRLGILMDIADLSYEIGSSELGKEDFALAGTWLDRAEQALDMQQDLDSDAMDLKLNILHAKGMLTNTISISTSWILVRAFQRMGTDASFAEADRCLTAMQDQYGHKLAIQLLCLEVASTRKGTSAADISNHLLPIIRSSHLIDNTHRVLMHYIHTLHEMSMVDSITVLQEYTISRLSKHDNADWLRMAFITYIWFVSKTIGCDLYSNTQTQQNLNIMQQAFANMIDTETVRGCHAILWKKIGSLEGQDSQLAIISTCQLAMHTIFEKSGENNMNKFERKIIYCHLKDNDINSALGCLQNMSPSTADHKISKYLAYCISLRQCSDSEINASFSTFASKCQNDQNLMQAILEETIKYGSSLQKARVLQRMIDKNNYHESRMSYSDLSVLTLKYLIDALSEGIDGDIDAEIQDRLLTLLKLSLRYWKGDTCKSNPKASSEEKRWLANCANTIAMQQYASWPRRVILDLLEYSLLLSTINKDEFEVQNPQDQVFGTETIFLQIILYGLEARQCDNTWKVEDLPQTSFDIRNKPQITTIKIFLYQKCFDKFTRLQDEVNRDKELTKSQDEPLSLIHKVFPLAFESLAYLSSEAFFIDNDQLVYDDTSLFQMIDTATQLEAPTKMFALTADIILSFASTKTTSNLNEQHVKIDAFIPVQSATRLLARIVQVFRDSDMYDTVQASRWIRCIVQLLIEPLESLTIATTSPTNTKQINEIVQMLSSVLTEATVFARTSIENITPSKEPNHSDGQNERDNNDILMTNTPEASARSSAGITTYPPTELEWLSTTTFNAGLDLYSTGHEEQSRRCIKQAICLADVLALYNDTACCGLLAKLLRERVAVLGWDDV